MNDKVKDFLTKVAADPELKAQFDSFGKAKTQIELKKLVEEKILPWAKGLGFDLTLEDFIENPKKEIDEDELEAIAGGSGGCACLLAGGGGGKYCDVYADCARVGDCTEEEYDGQSFACACVAGGYGEVANGGPHTCTCILAGGGDDCG